MGMEQLTQICLVRSELTYFRVDHFPHLQSLDLSYNKIRSLRGTRLESAQKLESLTLSHNQIYNLADLSVL